MFMTPNLWIIMLPVIKILLFKDRYSSNTRHCPGSFPADVHDPAPSTRVSGPGWLQNLLIRWSIKASIINWLMWRICQLTQFLKILIINKKQVKSFDSFKGLAPRNSWILNMTEGETNNFGNDHCDGRSSYCRLLQSFGNIQFYPPEKVLSSLTILYTQLSLSWNKNQMYLKVVNTDIV